MINILGMNFADDNYPDVGTICVDKDDGNLLLLSEDIHKLNDTLTRAVCIGTYGVGVFPFRMGDTAFVIDLLKMFIYDSKNDCWLDVEELA